MNRFIPASDSRLAAGIRRWLPPDVDFDPNAVEHVEPEGPPPPTPEEIAALQETARREGFEAGYRDGYEAGYREGREQADREAESERAERAAREQEWRATEERTLRETVASLEGIARALADPLAELADVLEPELLMLVSALARRVVMAELTTRPELIQRVLHEALQQLPSRKHPIRLHVNPRDQEWLLAYAQSNDENPIWVPDPEIEPGGCLLISGPSRIDASLETRLRQGIEAIWSELEPPEPPLQADESEPESEPLSDSASVAGPESDAKLAPEAKSPAVERELQPEFEPESEPELQPVPIPETQTEVPPT
ncbi:MAG: FliH/SctL family protein [Thermochromatium sp.]